MQMQGKWQKVVHATNANAAKCVLFGVYKMQMRLKWQSASEPENANKWKCQITMGGSKCKCNVNVTHSAWDYNTGLIEHKLLFTYRLDCA